MKRFRSIYTTVYLACIIAAIPCRAQDPAALRLEVTLPRAAGKAALPILRWSDDHPGTSPCIHIVLRNTSRKPQPVWDKAFPVLEITTASGKKWSALNKYALSDGFADNLVGGAKNLPPGGTLAFDVILKRAAANDTDNPRTPLFPIHTTESLDTAFTFTPDHPAGKDAFPSGPVTLWIRCRVNVADTLLDDGIAARPVKCVIE